MEYLDIEYPIDYNGPIKVKLEIPMPMAERGSVRECTGNSKKLYVDFYLHKSERIHKSTGLTDTPDNHLVAQAILNELIYRADHGRGEYKFIFEELFPDAGREQKERIALLEDRAYHPPPDQVVFGDYVEKWERTHMLLLPPATRKKDKSALKKYLLPNFKDFTFSMFTRTKLKFFVYELRKKQLSKKTITAIITALRHVFFDAEDEHDWSFKKDPFDKLYRHYPTDNPAPRIVLRFYEYEQIVQNIDPFFRVIVDFMLLTGANHSELTALKWAHIEDGRIHFQESKVRKYHKDGEVGTLKEKSRNRKMPITKAIQIRLDILYARAVGEKVFSMPDGSEYDSDCFRDKFWKPAVKKAGVDYHIPYELRHSFTGWGLIVGIDKLRLTSLMGHASKARVDDTYGFYVEGLEDDREKIIAFFGEDFVKSKEVIEQPLLKKGGRQSGWKGSGRS